MKKLTFLVLSLLALSLTACDSGSDDATTTSSTADVVTSATYSIKGTVSAPSTVTLYKGTTAVKSVSATIASGFEFTGLEKASYTVKITATDYVAQSVDVTLSDTNTDAIITANMVKASTTTVDTANVVSQASAVTVTNDAASKASTGAAAEIVVPAATTITNTVSASTFSITPYLPATSTTALDKTTGTTTVQKPVMAFECEPSGATFSQPIKISVDMNENAIPAEYMKLVNGTEEKTVSLSGTTYSAEIDHFSTWTMKLNPTVEMSDELTTTTSSSKSLSTGSTVISFPSYVGYEKTSITQTYAASNILLNFIESNFGAAKTTVTKTATATATGNGTLSYNIIQKYKTATIKLGSTTVAIVKINLGSSFVKTGFTASTHSGGTGK